MRDRDDRARFERLYAEHYPEILRYAARRADLDTARDAAAETFTAAWRRLGDVPAHAARAWLFTTARNILVNQYRTTARLDRLCDRIRSTAEDAVPDHAQAVTDRLHIQNLLAKLTDEDREALELIEWDGLSATEAAQAVGCSAATFRVRLHRARRRLVALYDRELAEPTSTLLERSTP